MPGFNTLSLCPTRRPMRADTVSPRRQRPRTSPGDVLDDDNLLTEILLRLPPRPSSLPRASLVSKRWRRLATDRGFFRRFRDRHRDRRPLLGVFEKQGREAWFKPVLDSPDRIPSERFSLRVANDFEGWSVLGCRHGRLLAMNRTQSKVIVFDPISGDRRIMAAPADFVGTGDIANGALLCAGGGDGQQDGDHLALFKVILVGISCIGHKHAMARIYSSKTGVWGNLISAEQPCTGYVSRLPCTLVGNALYWWLHNSADGILEFDLDKQRLAMIKSPPAANVSSGRSRIIRAEDGRVGFAVLSWPSFQLWDRIVGGYGDATWVLRKTVQMNEVLGLESSIAIGMATVLAYSEEAHAILVSVCNNVFMVQLESMQHRKLNGMFLENIYYPFSDFYPSGIVSTHIAAPAIEALN